MMINRFISQLQATPESVQFADVMAVIDANYSFIPSQFKNGDVVNEAGQNSASCKIFAFGLLHELSEAQTLACFGEYYRDDVLNNPNADNHANIRSFMEYGWPGISFSESALVIVDQ